MARAATAGGRQIERESGREWEREMERVGGVGEREIEGDQAVVGQVSHLMCVFTLHAATLIVASSCCLLAAY